ncbi:MAG: rod shape-determining protein MreD [Bacteroidetes bacterium]|uniref:Rod shape-determining protein MreD n=1 Tax=Phaeocystidibacter marisrubri TaxID=1577780 RepID=A0A6L3ZD84_9FLAO|nr:rod shape-determining protein MreD [Phaeocystidibacter marisrubri]KAB2815805.1 rod shape-determining protein MreD [Phaeocystidibacter marisrubri]TNE28540.1 MAG: rod shape-determining protein MreD [Bacteroidota bacterium]GGH65796.1 rod shape-determining protein MreD [Phaeocystidibacter marisrubri]
MSDTLRTIGRLLFLSLFQILILNHIQLSGYLNPYLYVLFVLTLPAGMSRTNLLFWGFASGLIIDIFENSGGAHASATLLLAYLRPTILRLTYPRADEDLSRVSLWTMGSSRFFTYVSIGIIVHHFWLFLMEAFRISEVLSVLSRTFISVPVTLVMIYITQLFVYREES